jgi:hypothetical protein
MMQVLNSTLDTLHHFYARSQSPASAQLTKQQPSRAAFPPVDDWFLPAEVVHKVLGYLDAPSLASVQATERRLRRGVAGDEVCSNQLWFQRSKEDFKISSAVPEGIIPTGIAYREYLRLQLQRCEDELAHTTGRTYSRLASGLSSYVRSKAGASVKPNTTNAAVCGIVGMVCDLVAFEDRAVGRAIAQKRQSSMNTVIVENSYTVLEFKKAGTVRGPMTFLPLSSSILAFPVYRKIKPLVERDNKHTITAPGFIGFASELVQLRPEHEYLRDTIIANNVLKNMQVWDSEAAFNVYKLYLVRKQWEWRMQMEHQGLDPDSTEAREGADEIRWMPVDSICYVALDTYGGENNTSGYLDQRDDNDYDAGVANMMLMPQVSDSKHMCHRSLCHLERHEAAVERALQKRNNARSAVAFAEYGM